MEMLDDARRAFVKRTRARFLNGAPLKLLKRKLAPENFGRYFELVAHIPPDLGPMLAMEWVTDRLNDPLWTPAEATADERHRLQQRADDLRAQLQLCAYDDPSRAALEAELYRCVDALNVLPFEEAL